MTTIDNKGNHHAAIGQAGAGRFLPKRNSAPSGGISGQAAKDGSRVLASRRWIRALRASDFPSDGSGVTLPGAHARVRLERAKRFYLVGVCGDPHQNVTTTNLREAKLEAEHLLQAPSRCEHCIPKADRR